MPRRLELLQQVRANSRFVEGLSWDDIKAIAAQGSMRRIRANTQITRANESADHLFLLLHGSARGYTTTNAQGEKRHLIWVLPGETIGWSVLTRMSYIVSSETMQDVVALVWDQSTIDALRRTYSQLNTNGLALAHDYMSYLTELHVSTSLPIEERLAKLLYSLTSKIGRRVDDGVELCQSAEQLASQIQAHRNSVNKLLFAFETKGLVRKPSRNVVIVRRPEQLLRVKSE